MAVWKVKSCGEKNLQDGGKRDLDEEIRYRLSVNYPDWKRPESTHMIPSFFIPKEKKPDVGEITEEYFFHVLETFGKIKKEPMFVIHSYKFSEHIPLWLSGKKSNTKMPTWVMGEHDFVIVHPVHAVVFFQVKATETSGGHPKANQQLDKDKYSLKIFLQKMEKAGKISNSQISKIFNKTPAFVVLPNTERGQGQFAKDNVIYKEHCISVEAFCKWWDEKFKASEKIDSTIFEYLVMRFVGLFCASPLLGHSIDHIQNTLIFNTEEQVGLLVGHYPPNLWIRGPAGSGKTMLLLKKAECLASCILEQEKQEKILIVCFNTVLCKMLQSKLQTRLAERFSNRRDVISKILHVTTFTKLVMDVLQLSQPPSTTEEKEETVCTAITSLSTGISPARGFFDHILVDEGQDLFGSKWPELLKLMHKSFGTHYNEEVDLSNPNGLFWVMYDTNQYLYFSREQLELFSGYLQNSANLKEVLRNTGKIFKQSVKYFKSLMTPENAITLGHRQEGLDIIWDSSLQSREVSYAQAAYAICPHVEHLQKEHVQEKDICILVETVEKRRSIARALFSINIETQTADSLVEKNANRIVVESIRRFKGLESKVVILYDPPFEDDSRINGCTKELLYTAVSRCFCYLIVITTPAGCQALMSDQGIQEITSNTAQQVPQGFPTWPP